MSIDAIGQGNGADLLGLLSQGAAISLAIFPILLLVVIVQLVYIRKAETA
jgi:hypothetical protein